MGRYRFSAKLMESAEKRQRLSLSLEMVNGQDFVASHSDGQDDKPAVFALPVLRF